MLKTRILTALVMAPFAFAIVFALPQEWFLFVVALLLLLGAWEFRRLADLEAHAGGWFLVVLQAAVFAALYIHRPLWIGHIGWVLAAACAAWLLMFLRLVVFQGTTGGRYRAVSFACAMATLSCAWIALAWLRQLPQGAWWILLLLLIIWAADIGAYFLGRAFGQKKLAPRLSPGKTTAGLYGGIATAGVAALLAAPWLPTAVQAPVLVGVVAVVTALASVGGDLLISLHKRATGHKDSGGLFPGHGGVLDRLDSLMAGAPFFALGKLLAGI